MFGKSSVKSQMRRRPEIPEDLFLSQGKEIEKIFQRAVREALRRHKRLGNSVAAWRDGKVVILSPEEIILDDDAEKNK